MDKIKNKVIPTATWIKDNKHALRMVGGLMFVLALIAGVIWAMGAEIEPVAFILGMLSSMFLASPSVAEYFVPDRKPVRHMSFDEILEFIQTTDPKNDWQGINTNHSSQYFLKEDPRLRFKTSHDEDGVQNPNFIEDWANCHPDSHAAGYYKDLYYDGEFIDRYILVAVDGAKALIPPPNFKTKKIDPLEYHIAKIFDILGTLDQYIKRSSLEVAERVAKVSS